MSQGRGEMRRRTIILPVDDLLRILIDYAGDKIPADAMPDALLKHPQTGLLGLKIAGNWMGDKGQIVCDFKLKRVFGTPRGVE